MNDRILKQGKIIAKFGEFASFLDARSKSWQPPNGDEKLKRLNLMMAACVLVRVNDEMKRRSSEGYAEKLYDVREAIDQFKGDDLQEALIAFLRGLDGIDEKLMPVSPESANAALLALMDCGLAQPVGAGNLHDEILNNRSILMAIASVFAPHAKKIRKEHDDAPKN